MFPEHVPDPVRSPNCRAASPTSFDEDTHSMTSTITAANPAHLSTVDGFPAINQEAAGLLKMVWRLSEIEDDWTKGGSIHPAWDRWTYWPYMAKVTYNLTFAVRMIAKI